MKQVYHIDGRCFGTLDEFFRHFCSVAGLHVTWPLNLDGFNDVLRGGFGTPDEGFDLVWHYSEESRRNLGYRETVRQLEQRLRNCYPTNRHYVQQELDLARRGEGATAFDWILNVIRAHPEIGLKLK